jgi:hypothetical protein
MINIRFNNKWLDAELQGYRLIVYPHDLNDILALINWYESKELKVLDCFDRSIKGKLLQVGFTASSDFNVKNGYMSLIIGAVVVKPINDFDKIELL